MEPQENKHKYLKTLLTVLVGIVLIGGTAFGVWYWQQNEMKKQKSDSDKQIQELQKQINELKKDSTGTSNSTSSNNASTKSYTNSATHVSFSYPKDYTLTDQTNTAVGSPGDTSMYYHSDFVKAALDLTKNGARVSVLILESTDMDKVLSSFGDTSNNKTIVKYDDYSGYVATNYGTGFNSKIIVDTIVGSRYSVAISAPDPTYSTMLDDIIRSVKFN